jgi:hypothetical protein
MKILPCTYDQWDEALEKSKKKIRHISKNYHKQKQATVYKNIYGK